MSPVPTLIVGIDPGNPTTAVVARREDDGSMTIVDATRDGDWFPIEPDPVWESLKAEFGDWDPIASSGWSDAALEFGKLWDEQWAFAEEWVEYNPHRASEPRWTEPEYDETKPVSTSRAKTSAELEAAEIEYGEQMKDLHPIPVFSKEELKGMVRADVPPFPIIRVPKLTPEQKEELREKFKGYLNDGVIISTPREHSWVKDRFLEKDQVHHPLEWVLDTEPEPLPSEEAEPPPAQAPKNHPTPRRPRKRKRRR